MWTHKHAVEQSQLFVARALFITIKQKMMDEDS